MTVELLVLAGFAAACGYLGWCWVFPYATCWRCKGRDKAGDGKGHYRFRRTCRVCGGEPYRRWGARMIGRR